MERHNLYVFRCDKKLTQEEMAKCCGVSRATYIFIEKGKRGGSAEFWKKLQEVFNIPDERMYLLMKVEGKE
jgi:DNA-binding XRE family transcriptional regulator